MGLTRTEIFTEEQKTDWKTLHHNFVNQTLKLLLEHTIPTLYQKHR